MSCKICQLLFLFFAAAAVAAQSDHVDVLLQGSVCSQAFPDFLLPLANVSILNTSRNIYSCSPMSQLARHSDATFEFACSYRVPAIISLHVWARQYMPKHVSIKLGNTSKSNTIKLRLALDPRKITNFPAKRWRFDGWAIEAQNHDVPHTNISFLSHPSAYRTPSGRIFMISTAGSTSGEKPGWTQGYWQSEREVGAKACGDGPLISSSHSGVEGVSMSARLIFAEGRLLMVTGIEKLSQNRMVTILENKNLEDPCHSEDWVGVGTIQVNFTGAPTSEHEDYRLHIFDGDLNYTCNGEVRKYWLLVIPDDVPGYPGRARGRMAFASRYLTGPYSYCDWAVPPAISPCRAFPGDTLLSKRDNKMYFVESYGSLYIGSTTGPLEFQKSPQPLVTPGPPGEWDDLGQVALTFLAATGSQDKRARLYHATYSSVSGNENARKADFGYKLAIGMYSFEWADET